MANSFVLATLLLAPTSGCMCSTRTPREVGDPQDCAIEGKLSRAQRNQTLEAPRQEDLRRRLAEAKAFIETHRETFGPDTKKQKTGRQNSWRGLAPGTRPWPMSDGGRRLFRTRPCSVILRGRFKLHECFEDGALELYDLVEDIGERNNLADEKPDKRDELHRILREWRASVGAPIPERN